MKLLRSTVSLIFLLVLSTSMGSADTEVVVVGIDGGDWKQIDRLIEEGRLENISRFVKEGQRGELNSVRPVMSPVAWSSYSAGTDPSGTGIFGFLQRQGDGFGPVTAEDIDQPYFWDEIDGRSVIVNVPLTYPPEETEGVMVSGYLSPENGTFTYPESLSDELRDEGYIIEPLSIGYQERSERIVSRSEKAVEKRTDAALDLMREQDPRFVHVTYTGLDRVQHYYPLPSSEEEGEFDAVRRNYEAVDTALGRILEEAGPDTTVILMSDHGFTGVDREVYLNHWMKEQGYLETKKSESLLGRLGITQQRMAPVLEKLHLLRPLKSAMNFMGFQPSETVPQPGMNHINLDETKAYIGNYRGAVYIVDENVEDRERFRQELESELRDIEIDGEPLVDEVRYADEIYEYDHREMPDMVIEATEGNHIVGFLGKGKLYTDDPRKTGMHERTGVIATNDPDLKLREEQDITDIAPTVLDLLNASKPDYMTGESLVD